MSVNILTVQNLTKIYQDKKVVDHVSMTIDRGDIYGFVGVNGAGKTTFMRMLCGLAKPTEGSISLFGETENWGADRASRPLYEYACHDGLSALGIIIVASTVGYGCFRYRKDI